MHQSERLTTILDLLAGDANLRVTDLAEQLGVSAATVRRDLGHLQEQRLLERTHGGAVRHGMLYELPLRYRTDRARGEKRRIGAAAAALAPDGAAVGLTGGTTTTEVARALAGKEQLTVVTNALNIASELAVRPHVKLVVTGGVARSESYELVGPFAEETLSQLYLDIAFVGADGVSAGAGLTTHHDVEARTNQMLIERARRVIVVADGSKVGRVTFVQICPIHRVHQLITDAEAEGEELDAVREAGVDVMVV